MRGGQESEDVPCGPSGQVEFPEAGMNLLLRDAVQSKYQPLGNPGACPTSKRSPVHDRPPLRPKLPSYIEANSPSCLLPPECYGCILLRCHISLHPQFQPSRAAPYTGPGGQAQQESGERCPSMLN